MSSPRQQSEQQTQNTENAIRGFEDKKLYFFVMLRAV